MPSVQDLIASWLANNPALTEKCVCEQMLSRRGFIAPPAAGLPDADVRVELINRLRKRGDGASLEVLKQHACWEGGGNREADRVGRAARIAVEELERKLASV